MGGWKLGCDCPRELYLLSGSNLFIWLYYACRRGHIRGGHCTLCQASVQPLLPHRPERHLLAPQKAPGPPPPTRHSLCKENRFPNFHPVGVLCRVLNVGAGGTGRWLLHVAWWDPTMWI